MSQLRKDPISGRWVMIAENRAHRPTEFERDRIRRVRARCPFCAGNEQDTPDAIANYSPSSSNDDDWQVRVVPNKYPAVDSPMDETHVANEFYPTMKPVGAHEVIIESAQHCVSVTELTHQQIALVFTAYRDRLRSLSENPNLSYGLIFRNAGPASGASLEHLHSQLIAMPFVPPDAQLELNNVEQFHQNEGTCVFCAIAQHELATRERIIAESPRFVVFCPFASRFAFETWILPRSHESRFEHARLESLDELSVLFRETIRRIEVALDQPAYNTLLHSAPFDTSGQDHYHWHMRIFPRLAEVAGFELGSGCYINSTPPELAARTLRATQIH